MTHWYKLSLGDGMTSDPLADEIKVHFERAFLGAGEPQGMAVFTRAESEGRLHCEVFAYFTPLSEETARAFGARPCNPPVHAGLRLLAGDETSP